ncbi:hypothetical protein JDV02_003822 [Purpureocillium takamizusanense]|uniref:Peptidase M20 domain-containing protein 2 n=1 Tax=Purpureocillium takamizusanense TaxID=2060973 RepID=A0A9Q8VA67_9HYPO|nr:uncharacterized protein JDV02_003822 [Purpureocillium takamizusanense]UNI17481.1 hypothetical protein JDV02_003822 [Purpureocillium takamizusanense]
MTSTQETIATQQAEIVAKHTEELWRVNQEIHSHPELAFKETHAHDTVCGLLESLGYSVTRHAHGLKTWTAFEVEAGSDGGVVVYNAEYDALPGIGRACGHNLIATSSIAAFLATADALKANNISGRVRLLGTPGEEEGGGKVALLSAGAYRGVDACLMGHPGPLLAPVDGVVHVPFMAVVGVTVTFNGVNAHAGNAPWLGKNALDAAVGAYNNISMLRQQMSPEQRVHAVITHGGDRANVIPHRTEMRILIRASTNADLEATRPRIASCSQGAADATGCTVDLRWDHHYKDLQCSGLIESAFAKNAAMQGRTYMAKAPTGSGASTDQGNYEIPSIHPIFLLDVEDPSIGPHHRKFAATAGTRASFAIALEFAKVMAATGLDILQSGALREELTSELAAARNGRT